METSFEITDEARARAREAFKQSGLSKYRITKDTNISWGSLSAFLNGPTRTFSHLPAFANAVGRSVEWILEGKEKPKTVAFDRNLIEGMFRSVSRARNAPIDPAKLPSMVDLVVDEWNDYIKFYGTPPSPEVCEVILQKAFDKAG